MFRCAGERDIEVQEIMRQVLELKLYCKKFFSGSDSYFR